MLKLDKLKPAEIVKRQPDTAQGHANQFVDACGLFFCPSVSVLSSPLPISAAIASFQAAISSGVTASAKSISDMTVPLSDLRALYKAKRIISSKII